jgi:transcriptional regulator with XRE-family HTH domain
VDRHELADFLRNRRGRLQPSDVGLEAGTRRRTPGLRREEVARLAGMSTDYYARLEQERGPRPSEQVLEALARALRLRDEERMHLFYLAGLGHAQSVPWPRQVRPGILHLLDRLDDTPAYVLDARYDVLAWNALASALLTDFSALPPERCNLLWVLFCDPATGKRLTEDDWARMAKESVAGLRAAAARYAANKSIPELVRRLSRESAEFAKLWADHDVQLPQAGTKRILHPVVGPIELDYEVLLLQERSQRLVLYTAAPGSTSSEALHLLKVIGMQSMAGSDGH